MKKLMSLKIILILMAFSMLTGCYFGGAVDSLLSPPKLSKEQDEIYNALVSAIGSDIHLVYPKSGEYRSPYIIQNIDDDPDMEAIVFYEAASETEGSNIRINILDQINGKWVSVYDHAGIGSGIERIIFSKLGASDDTSIIIGYSMLSNEKSVKVYNFSDGILSNLYTDNYSNMFVTDMEKDNTNELVVIHPNSPNSKAFISCLTNLNGKVVESTTVGMNPESTEFINIAHGYVGKTTPALFIDSLTAGQLSTEIVYVINGKLRNPLYVNDSIQLKDTVRPTGYLCTDIDLDSIIEIPTLELSLGYNTDSTDKEYITNWNVYENYSITKKYSSYYNLADGYVFILPSRWENVVVLKTDKSTGEMVFYRYNTNLENSTTELLRFFVADNDELQAKLDSGYSLIKTGKNNFLYKSAVNEDEPLILTDTEILKNFYIMSDR